MRALLRVNHTTLGFQLPHLTLDHLRGDAVARDPGAVVAVVGAGREGGDHGCEVVRSSPDRTGRRSAQNLRITMKRLISLRRPAEILEITMKRSFFPCRPAETLEMTWFYEICPKITSLDRIIVNPQGARGGASRP